MAAASAEPYANNLHLAPDITTLTPHHLILQIAPIIRDFFSVFTLLLASRKSI